MSEIPEVFAIFEQKLAHVLSFTVVPLKSKDLKNALEEILTYFSGIVERASKAESRIAELEAVIEILEDQQREAKNILIDKNLHIDSLYEEGYKLQQRIAELEERLELCESALISMTYQFFYSSESGALMHSFMSAEEEAAEYLVDYGIARWENEHKNSIVFEEVQE